MHQHGPQFSITPTIPFAAKPSQSSGILPSLFSYERTFCAAFNMSSPSTPTKILVPFSMVTGLSVFSRRVRQGIFRIVASSCIPPESVKTYWDCARS